MVLFRLLTTDELPLMLPLMADTHPDLEVSSLTARLKEMQGQHYGCVGGFDNNELVAVAGFWITTRFYSGRQIEVDNVAVAESCRSLGLGTRLMEWVCEYGRSIGCGTCELNTYVHNTRSHKFYLNNGFRIIGYHLEKALIRSNSGT